MNILYLIYFKITGIIYITRKSSDILYHEYKKYLLISYNMYFLRFHCQMYLIRFFIWFYFFSSIFILKEFGAYIDKISILEGRLGTRLRQLVYTMFITNNHVSFHLWWQENFVKHQTSQSIMSRVVCKIFFRFLCIYYLLQLLRTVIFWLKYWKTKIWALVKRSKK